MRLLKSAAISAFHRLGLFHHLRESWREDLGKGRERWTAVERGVNRLDRSLDNITQTFPSEVGELHDRLRKVERTLRTIQNVMAIDQEQHGRRLALEATLDDARVRASVERAVATATFHTSPMPHAVLQNLLPRDTYDAVLEAIPRDEFFPDKDPIKQNFKLQQLDVVPSWTRRGIAYLEGTIIDAILGPAIVARMRPHLEDIYGTEYGPSLGPSLAAVPHGPIGGRLMLRRPGYKLEPHLDPRRVAITCLLYFARPGDDAAYGTELYEVDRPVTVDRSNTFYPEQHGYKCRLVKTVPFAANSALVFLNRVGAHAAEIPDDAPRDTKRFAYQFYISPDQAAFDQRAGGLSKAESKPALV